ncbi:MAG: cytochrome P450 [Burkholderiales bacterium]|nr:cytochrome P450 [Burkholderiales bacterium]
MTYKRPPGPIAFWFGFPILGELLKDALGTVQRFHEQYGDVVYFQIANETFYYLFSPELIREALLDHADDFIRHQRTIDVFTQVYGANVLTTEGDAWKRQRRILMPGFLPKKVAGYLDLMVAASTDNLSASFRQAKGETLLVDVESFTRKITVDVILRVLFSHKASEEDSINALEATLTLEHQGMREFYWPFTPPDWVPYPGRTEKLNAKATLQNLISGQIQLRRDRPQEHADKIDYLSMLLAAKDEEAQGTSSAATLTVEEIRDNCMVIFAAGHDTTATVLTWWIALMAEHRDVADKVRQEIAEVVGDRTPTADDLSKLTLLNATLKEAMRLYPPAPLLFARRVISGFQLGEWHIPKGANVNIPVWHVHHDARWYADPEKFLPERFLAGAPDIPRGAYMPFGTGPRVCIGQHFATMEMALIAALLLREFDFAFSEAQGMPKPKVDMVLKPEKAVMVNFIRR